MTSPTQPPPVSAIAPDDDSIQPPWSMGFGGLWPCSEWLAFESPKTPQQLKADLRANLGPVWDIVTPGFKGWVLGPFVRIGWLPKWYNLGQRSHLAFRGMVKATPTGSRLTGYVRMHLLLQFVLGLYYFATVGVGLMWLGSGWPRYGWEFLFFLLFFSTVTCLLRIGAKTAVRKIQHHLAQVCGAARGQEPKKPESLTPV
ncbi:MAG: hypothetical protein ACO1TE_29365 [Prosthecobacter sp.]